MTKLSPSVRLGVATGLIFFAHAMIPNSNAWPLIWPALAGTAAIALSARRGRIAGFWQGVGVAAKAGATAGALFFVATALSLWLLSSGAFEPVAQQLGAEGPVVVGPAALMGLALAALIGTVLAALSGAAAYPFAKRRERHG